MSVFPDLPHAATRIVVTTSHFVIVTMGKKGVSTPTVEGLTPEVRESTVFGCESQDREEATGEGSYLLLNTTTATPAIITITITTAASVSVDTGNPPLLVELLDAVDDTLDVPEDVLEEDAVAEPVDELPVETLTVVELVELVLVALTSVAVYVLGTMIVEFADDA